MNKTQHLSEEGYMMGYLGFINNMAIPDRVQRNPLMEREWWRGYNGAYFANINKELMSRKEAKEKLKSSSRKPKRFKA